MPSPRYTQIDIDATPFYHCISRCVRRAFLCGEDYRSGRNFDHRKRWVVEKLAQLSEIFAIRICAYAVLSNHFHLVVRIDRDRAAQWSDDAVIERYGTLFRRVTESWNVLPPAQAAEQVAVWRARLSDLSWFMRCLNESIARRANEEDDCTGRFWEGRFRSQALLDEAGLITCMSYVDLNPIRAGMAEALTDSDFTSIQQRLAERAANLKAVPRHARSKWPELSAFAHRGSDNSDLLPIAFDDYIELLASTAAAVRSKSDDPGLSATARRVLDAVHVRSDLWVETVQTFRRRFFSMIGCVHRIELHCARTDRNYAKGSRWASRAFQNCA